MEQDIEQTENQEISRVEYIRELIADSRYDDAMEILQIAMDEQIDRAIGSYLKALMLNEKFAPAYKKLGTLFLGRNDKESAIEYFEDYIKLDIPQEEKEQTKKILSRIKGG